jgi:chitinase
VPYTRSLSDEWADTEKRFPGDSTDETGTNLYGCLKQFYLLKQQNRNLKVLLSIGGSSYSSNFAVTASTASGRSTFASTVVTLIKNLGFDGLDIDWEFPSNDTESTNMVLLLQAVRESLDAYGDSLNTPYHFQLTVACPSSPSNYQTMHLADMDQYVDFWNLMAYNYAGSWSTVTADQANLFSSGSNPPSTPFDTKTAINYYTSQNIRSNKIVLGMPVYGWSFEATDGLGKSFNGVGQGTWEAGIYDFKVLPLSGAIEFYDSASGSSYSYDATKRELISYDNVTVSRQKAAWIQETQLGGAMWWESSADGADSKSLIQNVVEVLGGDDGSGLESSPNQLLYPDSTYDNIRAGLPGSGSVSAIMPTSTVSLSEACSSVSLSTSSLLTTSSPSTTVLGSDTSSSSTSISPSATPSGSSPSGSPAPTQFTTSTVHTTSVSTIISCASTVENCPAHSTILTTVTVPISTTICPVTETSTGSSQPNSVSASSAYDESFSGTQSTIIASIEVVSSTTGSSFSLEAGSTATTRDTSDEPPQSSLTSTLVPGENGVPGCAYILASDLSDGALCSSDYCNCGGTVAPLLTSSISGTLTTNCNYQTQPVANSCPTLYQTISASSSTISSSSTYSTSSLSAPSSSSTSSSILDASTSSTSSTPLATSSNAATSTSGPDCVISGHCNTYKLLACPGGDCFCGQDINDQPTCFENQYCHNLRACSRDADCATNEACGVMDCCGNGAGLCLRRAAGCMNSPAAKVPYWLPYPPSCKIRKRGRIASTDHAVSERAKRLAC